MGINSVVGMLGYRSNVCMFCMFLQPTAEQIRYAQLLNTEDSKAMRDKIKQVMFKLIVV